MVVGAYALWQRVRNKAFTVGARRAFGRLGPGADLDERRMADEIAAKAEDVAWRTEMTSLGMRLIDGAGARRVAEALAEAGAEAEAAGPSHA